MGLFKPAWMTNDFKKRGKAIAAIRSIASQRELMEVVLKAPRLDVAEVALERIDDPEILYQLALVAPKMHSKDSRYKEIACFVASRIDDQGLLHRLAADHEAIDEVRAAAAGATSIDHISVAKDNTTDISVPLAYGTYYYYDENNEVQTLTVSAAHPVFSRNYDFDVQLQTADLQYAQISANRRGSDGTLTPVENAFTITSFTEDSTHSDHNQIRMSGT